MAQKMGFRSQNTEPFEYIESSSGSSIAFGFDSGTGTFNINTSASANAVPSEATSNIAIDPSANGDLVLQPNGSGTLNVLGVASKSVSNKNYVTINTSTGQLGSDNAPVLTIDGDSGSATGSTITIDCAKNMGATVKFVASGSTVNLTGIDANANLALNPHAGSQTFSGQSNALFGKDCAVSMSSGSFNTVIGGAAGYYISSGANNSVLGCIALGGASYNGSNTIAIGYEAGLSYTSSESSNIVIGNAGTAAESNVIRLGTSGSGAGQQNKCFVAGIYNVTPSGAPTTAIIDSNGQLGSVAGVPTTWTVISADQSAAVSNGYICNKAGLLTLTLPTTAAVGTIIEVTGINTALGWKVAQNSGQQIFFGLSSTTLGATGYLASTQIRDTVKLLCVVANTTWNVISSVGNITIA